MRAYLIPTAVLLAIAASGCSNRPVRVAASHPPASDLVCPDEPPALTDEQVRGDTEQLLEAQFDDAVLLAGRACRDALARIRAWHVARGMQE